MIKLHLGCGETYLKGYTNIDFPPDKHTVQKKSVADIYEDITKLYYPAQSIQEIRSHHLFEHFPRPEALALLCNWNTLLVPRGILIIETPDFEQSILAMMKEKSYEKRQGILRHIFGSHEAPWALHYDGWYKEKFEHILPALGFSIIDIKQTAHQITKNITVTAQKVEWLPVDILQLKAKEILQESLINRSKLEQELLDVWLINFNRIIDSYDT